MALCEIRTEVTDMTGTTTSGYEPLVVVPVTTRGRYTIKKHHKWMTESQILLSCNFKYARAKKGINTSVPLPHPHPPERNKSQLLLEKTGIAFT